MPRGHEPPHLFHQISLLLNILAILFRTFFVHKTIAHDQYKKLKSVLILIIVALTLRDKGNVVSGRK